MTLPLRERLRELVDLRVPGFLETVPAGEVGQWCFDRRDPADWYRRFVDRLTSARGFLPIYRMSDGEFLFVCGKRPLPWSMLPRFPKLVVKDQLRVLLRWRGGTYLSGTAGNSYETYTPEEWARAREGYADRVRAISERGILAVNFVHHREFPRQYFHSMCDWMDEHRIALTPENYYAFYFIYAALLGPDARRICRGKRVLVVTSDTRGDKAPAIRDRLIRLGAAEVAFIPISPSKSMFERIDLSSIGGTDLVLIGAGVGALNIIEQVAKLDALTIDAGFALDCYWKPREFVGLRAFTRPDQEQDTEVTSKPAGT